MTAPISLYRGDSSDVIHVRPMIKNSFEAISSDWVCRTALIGSDGSVLVASRVESTKTDDELYFVVSLSPDDTLAATVPAGKKFETAEWIIQVSNDQLTPVYSREKVVKVNLREQRITE